MPRGCELFPAGLWLQSALLVGAAFPISLTPPPLLSNLRLQMCAGVAQGCRLWYSLVQHPFCLFALQFRIFVLLPPGLTIDFF